jgi:TBC1 domain family member 15
MTIELDSTLAQAEVLFLSFAQLAADIDRRNAEANSASMLRKRHTTLKDSGAPVNKASSGAQPQATTNSTDVTTSTKLPELSSELRELLKAGR